MPVVMYSLKRGGGVVYDQFHHHAFPTFVEKYGKAWYKGMFSFMQNDTIRSLGSLGSCNVCLSVLNGVCNNYDNVNADIAQHYCLNPFELLSTYMNLVLVCHKIWFTFPWITVNGDYFSAKLIFTPIHTEKIWNSEQHLQLMQTVSWYSLHQYNPCKLS